MRRADAFGVLVPKSREADKMFDLRTNRLRIDATSLYSHILHPDHTTTSKVAKLNFAFMFGRRHLTFGTARSTEFQLPELSGVSACHFILHFDLDAAALLLTDTSETGTWIESRGDWILVHNMTHRIDEDEIRIHMGEGGALQFSLVSFISGLRQQLGFVARLAEYARSLMWPEWEAMEEKKTKACGSEETCSSSGRRQKRRASGDLVEDSDSDCTAKRRRLSQMVMITCC